MKLLGWLSVAVALQVASSAKILTILPMAVKSHSILFDRLIKELAKRGHDITYITPFESKEPTKNIKEIIIPDLRQLLMGNNTMTMTKWMPQWLILMSMSVMGPMTCSKILEAPAIKALIESDEKFDLIFGEPFIDEAIIAGFSYKNKAPIIALSTFMPNTWSNFLVGNPAPASYVPDPFTAFSAPLTFFQRTYNLLFGVLAEVTQRIGLILHTRVMRTHFGQDAPCVGDIIRNTSLLLVNHHPTLSSARPQTPNTIDVAGMHIYPPKPLPKDLEEFMTKSTNGVILFSMGTNVKSSDLPKQTIEGILRALGKLKENVLWKFEEELENLPKNVKITKWLPQSDILAHPNLKMFITHGGLLSTTEAVFRGVPIVGIPVMADQPINMQHTENAGLGITLDLDRLSEDTLYEAVTEVLTNPRYREVAKVKSRQLRDTPMTPLDSAVWWIEFVLRHDGAPHLRSHSHHLWWFQLHLIDVYAFLAVAGAASLAFNVCLGKMILRKIRERKAKQGKSGKTKSQKKNKNLDGKKKQ